MPEKSPAIEIPDQPTPDALDSDQEKIVLPNLGGDLEDTWEAELRNKAFWIRERETKLQKQEHELRVERVMLKQRKRYASRLFDLSGYWLLSIGAFLFLAGLEKLKVDNSVLIALITTTTANVLGLFYIVARWLFPNKSNDAKDDPPRTS